jgi:hypothetical protein
VTFATAAKGALAGLLAVSLSVNPALAQGEGSYGGPPAALNTDEAGLWMIFEQAERDIRRSPLLIKDPALNACARRRLQDRGPRCGEIRIYILDIPMFNASMAPNGMMHVWSGLLLRAENEAQLAFVLGHELKHYTAKHSLERWRSLRDTANALAFFSLIAAGAGVGFVGTLAQLAALGSLFSYNRDQEREADAGGLEALSASGYDVRAGAAIWAALMEEQKANKDRRSPSFSRDASIARRAGEDVARGGGLAAATSAPGQRLRGCFAPQCGHRPGRSKRTGAANTTRAWS